ncbi:MAG: helix-hairpin-helix domain-containing protein [Pirellulales bacterium]|nr:helix-hairpin-helix domain-containing protein [Pirellulales bacterium]
MAIQPSIDLVSIAQALRLSLPQVQAVIALLEAGNTVPFITRYRKDQTGGLDEEQIRDVQERYTQLKLLAERKQTILRSIEGQGKLTPELATAIAEATSTKRLEDLYLPYKPKKQTLATAARERGLELLANEILAADAAAADLDRRAQDFIDPDKGMPTAADALLGAGHILAEQFSERAALRQKLREILHRTGQLVSTRVESEPAPPPSPEQPQDEKAKAKQKEREKLEQLFRDYYDFRESLSRVPPHRVLAINRGERARVLRVRIESDNAALEQATDELLVPADHPHVDFLRGCGRDALTRLVLPSLEREIRREMTDRADQHAVEVFARNLRHLLLQPPVRGRRLLAVDPGFRSGCKLAALDEFGNLLDHGVVHIVGKAERRAEARTKIAELVRTHHLSVVVIGNGTACRQTEEVIASMLSEELADLGTAYVIVNEAGASVYSTSRLGREEFPKYDATLRGTISIGRRLQDPLSELVKIDPGSIGVGLYQHDVKAKHLRESLEAVVESCVNYVGVDLNTASPALLQAVSGLNQLTARRLYDYRVEHGPFRNREQLKEVPGFGEATFTQAAGFLKITGGDNPLDATWIHPESYPAATRVLERLGESTATLADRAAVESLSSKASEVDATGLAQELGVGDLTLRDILAGLVRPGRDPREDLPPPIFKRGVLKLEDLTVGMELSGTVLNVVDFGAFVDIGLSDSGLVHISQLANKFVPNPHEVVAVGDIVKVWVLSVDKERRRVSLTMIPPGSERPKPVAQAPAQASGGERRERPPKAGRRPDRKSQHKRRDQGHAAAQPPATGTAPATKPPARPKREGRQAPVVLTKAKREGREPLQTFGELKKLFELRDEGDAPKSS